MDHFPSRHTPIFLTLMLGLALGSTGCSEQGGKAAGQKSEVIATVNGEPVTEAELTEYSRVRSDSVREQNREALLDDLITQKVVYQDALRRKLDEDPEVLRELEMLRTRVLASAAVRKAMAETRISDEELSAEYEQLKGRMVAPEYKASHILVAEEEQAKKIIGQLNQGADFAQLAREHSTDASGKAGGDLGWFNPQQMVPPFAQAVGQLEKGSYTSEPVKTQFGWHVIRLDDSRQAEPPALEAIKGRLEQMLKQRRMGEYVQGLKDSAEIAITATADAPAAEPSQESAAAEAGASDTEQDDPAPMK